MDRPEVLSFTYKERYLDRKLIRNKDELKTHILFLAKKYKLPKDKIIFNHDFGDSSNSHKFINNFKLFKI